MRRLRMDSILLLALAVPFIMNFRIGPGETPYWWFGLIFLGLLVYLVLDLLELSRKKYLLLKQAVLWFLIIGIVGSALISAIIVRRQTAPVFMVHDIILQLESAIQFFLQGKNPYAVDYFGTPLENWHYGEGVNPALYHFVMEPFYLFFSLPFYFLSVSIFGFFDGRAPLIFLFGMLLAMAAKLVKDPAKKLLFLIFLAFNPAVLSYLVEGRSDIFMFAFLFAGFYLLSKNHFSLAGILMALAFGVKQSAWPIFPFYAAFLWFKSGGGRENQRSQRVIRVVRGLAPFAITFGTIVLPFLVWNTRAFLESTVWYLSGSVEHSYPISGYGFGRALYDLGFIDDLKAYYPFVIWQILIGLPLMIVLLKYLKKSLTVARLIAVYGIFLFVFWYFSRYFNNSHLGYLSLVFVTAYFWPEDGV